MGQVLDVSRNLMVIRVRQGYFSNVPEDAGMTAESKMTGFDRHAEVGAAYVEPAAKKARKDSSEKARRPGVGFIHSLSSWA